ncbi:ABC transporter transmembrane domain-containing protein [Ruegeria marina]|uniref:ABC transporter transmembrane region n=1 Tax=Ruegeria marina TaxID=639004 RepID=A0A1G6S9D0_9RHOB|nr:ABC transporter transmembrane domain-containing protein [Ruegeria marina]SDD12755.1 ABC transporter transmembrane region [Ruegeria marina]
MLQLYAAIWRVNARRQVVLILLSLAIAALAAVPLEFQRDIVNHLTEASIDTSQLYLLGAGMGAVILLSLFLKFLLGFLSGSMGEHVIRLLRKRLISRAVAGDHHMGQGTLTAAVTSEAEELGKFAGGAFADPVVQIGTLISVIGYISSTQPGLGLIAVLMILPQIGVVLLSQTQVNRYVAHRVKLLRSASDQLSSHDIAAVVAEVETKFDEIYTTRRNMFLWKLSTKFVLSAINGAGTVAVLMLGGLLVLQGRTDVGTVVAAVSGLGRIQGPSTFLIAFYRQVSANRIKFELLRDLIGQGEATPG